MRIGRNISKNNKNLSAEINTSTPSKNTKSDNDIYIALTGNPNSGKTTVFNALTGGRQKTGNYAGVTLEKKEGHFRFTDGRRAIVLDLPGLYSMSTHSPEEDIAQGVLLGLRSDTSRPDVALVVVDAANLERNLYLATQVNETGVPVIIALNMMDVARNHGLEINSEDLGRELGLPVIEMTAKSRDGIKELKELLENISLERHSERSWKMREETERVIALVKKVLLEHKIAGKNDVDWLARQLLFQSDHKPLEIPEDVNSAIYDYRKQLADSDDDLLDEEVIKRYNWIRNVYSAVVRRPEKEKRSKSERVDKIILHKVIGPIVFAVLMGLMFQAIFSWAELPMSIIEQGIAEAGRYIQASMPPGELKDLIMDGIISGVGNVLVFLPQIALLFFFIALLEDTGYMARAAFLMDRIMGRVGLNGHAFIPLLSSFACAVPGILATRTIRDSRDRIVTIMVIPLMTCSARLPVYMLLIAAFFPESHVFGFISGRGLIMLTLYLGGILATLLAAWMLKKFMLKGDRSPLLLEMPNYKLPNIRNVWLTIWNSSISFIKRAGTVILVLTIILWFLITHPKNAELEQSLVAEGYDNSQIQMELIRQSYIGSMGLALEPVVKPLGFDWKIGIGIISSFAAREVMISTLGTIYSAVSGEKVETLNNAMQADYDPVTGIPVWTPLVAASVLAFFVFACMCMSTLITIFAETNSLRWPVFVFIYTLALAYVASLIVYQGGRAMGFM